MSTLSVVILVVAVAVPALFVLGAVLLTRGATPTERPAILRAFGSAFAAVLIAKDKHGGAELGRVPLESRGLGGSITSLEGPVTAEPAESEG
jgi:hypothetical protein